MKQSLTPSVYIRFKPHSKDTVEFTSNTSIVVNGLEKRSYTFDHVFQPCSSTRQLFQICCKNHVSSCIKSPNKNALIFVYGNTGTGKTYTIGLLEKLNEMSQGLIPLSLKYIFSTGCEVSLAFYEIYNQEVHDLLNSGTKPLQIRQSQKEPYLQGLLEVSVSNFLEAVELINIGREQRKVAEQKLNRNSSRGHAVLTIFIHHHDSTVSKICFVDLAGSQRLKQTQSKGLNMTEAVHINSSLSSLETVLVSLANNTQPSFRASKLTRLLQPYFSSSISMIVTSNGSNTQNIEFAKRCKNIKIAELPEEQQTLSRIRYLQEELMKARKSLKRDVSLTPKRNKGSNKQNSFGLVKTDHNLSQSKTQCQEDKSVTKNLMKAIAKLLAVLESSYKVLENLCLSLDPAQHAYNFIKQLQIEDINTRKFVEERLGFLNQEIKAPKIRIKPKQILQTINDSEKFNRKIGQIGIGIIELSNNFNKSRGYVEEICTRELKCYLLEKKGRHNEEIISYLLSKIDKKVFGEVQAELKRMGVKVETATKKNSHIRIEQSNE